MDLAKIPNEGYLDTPLGRYDAKILVSEPWQDKKPWYVCIIYVGSSMRQRECCGRGRSPKVAIKFAQQALTRYLTKGI